jgi:hypothetical protein
LEAHWGAHSTDAHPVINEPALIPENATTHVDTPTLKRYFNE